MSDSSPIDGVDQTRRGPRLQDAWQLGQLGGSARILVCGTGVGTAIAASKVPGARAATAHDLVTVRGSVENYDAQILCMGQNVIAPAAAKALVDIWLDLRHDPSGSYAPRLKEIAAFEAH